MILTAFRVENYRSVLDSGWVDVHDVTLIVGKNESGKTSMLRALWKFNPYNDEPYDLSREWPRGRRKEMAGEKPVVTVRFSFTSEERQRLGTIGPSTKELTGVEIQRCYDGTYIYNFLPQNPEEHQSADHVLNVIKKHFGNTTLMAFEHVRSGYQSVLDALKRTNHVDPAVREAEEPSVVSPAVRSGMIWNGSAMGNASNPVNQAVKELQDNLPMRQAVELTHKWLPTFIYMDDYKVFKGSAQLQQLKQRKDADRLTEEDRTIIKILDMAGLNLDDEVQKLNIPDKEQRMLDLNDASQTLTTEIAHRWSQKKYEVLFQADGQHFITFVKDANTSILVPLEERSKGFQWFFSFDMTFMYETNGMFKNAVILLDEPGLHLHAAAQRDLLQRIREYARHNQLLYTTHLPFMIDFANLENAYVAEETGGEGTKVHQCWSAADRDSRFTLQAALGLSWAQSLFEDQYNLIVEDIADYLLLSFFSTVLEDAGQEGLDEQLVITPAGGAGKVAYVGTLLHDQHIHFAVLLNALPVRDDPYDELVRSWITGDDHVIMLDAVLEQQHPCTLEDLLPRDYYLEHVQRVYRGRLGNEPFQPFDPFARPIVACVTAALKERGIEHFDRDRIARRIIRDLAQRSQTEMSEVTLTAFARVIRAVNTLVQRWKGQDERMESGVLALR